MDWQQLHIITNSDQITVLEDTLMELGSLAITHQDAGQQAIFELLPGSEPKWDKTKLSALFTKDANLSAITETLEKQFPNLDYMSEQLPDQQWERVWLKNFKPMQFGNNTWICPTGFEIPQPDAITILLDPGLAFGTGTHPTTALCLTWIDQNDLQDKVIVDYGCGSGILAIAALKHGAKKVIAVDHDKQALIATAENAKRNGIALHQLDIYQPDNVPHNSQADIVMANILAEPLISLTKTLANFLPINGPIVLSGILAPQATLIMQGYKSHFDDFSITQQDDWLLMTSTKSH